jgi:Papain-like cysteine protease AvrRpt2
MNTAASRLAPALCVILAACQAYWGTYTVNPDGTVRTNTRYWQARPWITSDEDLGGDGPLPREQTVYVSGFNGVGAEQQRPDWCWAAAINMVLDHAGISASQREIVRTIFPDYERRGYASATQGRILDALNRFVYDRTGATRRLYPVALQANQWNNYQFITTIDAGYPVIAGMKKSTDGFGHIVVVHEVSFRQFDQYQAGISEVSFYDPYDGSTDTLSGREFAEQLSFAIATNVY